MHRQGHQDTTGPEIWAQTEGRVDGFICSVGTGGTLAGVAAALRERNARVKIGLVDPPGAALYSYYTTGELKMEGTSITEGVGQGRITRNLEGLEIEVLSLVVTRKVEKTCATELVQKEQGVFAPLPLDKPVRVTLKAPKNGLLEVVH